MLFLYLVQSSSYDCFGMNLLRRHIPSPKNGPGFCPEFTVRFREAVEYLQNEICTGKVTNAWTGKDYAQRGKTVLAKLLGCNGADVQV